MRYLVHTKTHSQLEYLVAQFGADHILVGTDYPADMAKMAADPRTREWWAVMMPMQQPLATRKEGEWWADMEEVFHMD